MDLLILERLLERGVAARSTLGMEVLVATIPGSLLCHMGTSTDKHHFGDLPLTSLCQRLSAHQLAGTSPRTSWTEHSAVPGSGPTH